MSVQQVLPRAGGAELPAAFEPIVWRIWSRARMLVPSDVLGDCEVEARLALWRAQPRLEGLPDEQRPRYAAVCVQRAVVHVLQDEIRAREGCVSLEALEAGSGAAPLASGHDTAAEAIAAMPLRDQIEDPAVAAAVFMLTDPEQDLLDLAYRHRLFDWEIAAAAADV